MENISLNIICDNVGVSHPHISLGDFIINTTHNDCVCNNITPLPIIHLDVYVFNIWDELSQHIKDFDTVIVIAPHEVGYSTARVTTHYMSCLRFIRVNIGTYTDYNELKPLLSMWGVDNINQVCVLMKQGI